MKVAVLCVVMSNIEKYVLLLSADATVVPTAAKQCFCDIIRIYKGVTVLLVSRQENKMVVKK